MVKDKAVPCFIRAGTLPNAPRPSFLQGTVVGPVAPTQRSLSGKALLETFVGIRLLLNVDTERRNHEFLQGFFIQVSVLKRVTLQNETESSCSGV